MDWFGFFIKKRSKAQWIQIKKAPQQPQQQTFILEPILTPSGLVEGSDQTAEPVVIDVDPHPLPDVQLPQLDTPDSADLGADFTPDGVRTALSPESGLSHFSGGELFLDEPIPEHDLEPLPFIYNLELTETEQFSDAPSIENPVQLTEAPTPSPAELLAQEHLSAVDGNASEAVEIPTEVDLEEHDQKIVAFLESPEGFAGGEISDLDDPLEGFLPAVEQHSTPPTFDSGVFTVGDTGVVSVEYLFDGGGYQGELAIFSLDGMEQFEPGSHEFIAQAAHRALSDSELGHIVIHDRTEGALFSGYLGEGSRNAGEYQGVKSFSMRPGDTFGVMLVPNGTVQQLLNNPAASGSVRPLFSLATANPLDAFHLEQIADVTGEGHTFAMEDLRVDGRTDHDYNDIIFSVRGATGKAVQLDSVINPARDWRGTDTGQALLAYTASYNTPPVDSHPLEPSPIDSADSGHLDVVVTPPVEPDSVVTSNPVSTQEVVTDSVETPLEGISNLAPTEEVVTAPVETHSIGTAEEVPSDTTASEPVDTHTVVTAELGNSDAVVTSAVDTDSLVTSELEPVGLRPIDPAEEVSSTLPIETSPTVTPAVDSQPVSFDFPQSHQPLVGVIDTGLSANHPDIDYSHITLGHDYVDGDENPLLAPGEGSEHGTGVLGIIAAKQNNGIGIDGINEQAPIWVGRAVSSGHWTDSLMEFVEAAKASGQPNAVVNLSFDLTQVNPDGTVTTRYELTPTERSAIEYARANHVLIVASAGNGGEALSALGQASQEFDNIITVGAADGLNRAASSSYGMGLDLLAPSSVNSTTAEGVGSFTGTSAATAQVTGAVSLVWAANPQLSYLQVKDILIRTATDLLAPGWDAQTGFGLLNLRAAVELAKTTVPEAAPKLPQASSSPNSTPQQHQTENSSSPLPTPYSPLPFWSERPNSSSSSATSSYSYTSSSSGDSDAGSWHESVYSASTSQEHSSEDGHSYTSSSDAQSDSDSSQNWNPSWVNYQGVYHDSSSLSRSENWNSSTSNSSNQHSSSSKGSWNWSGGHSRVSSQGSYQESKDSEGSAVWSSNSQSQENGGVSTSSSNREDSWGSNWDSQSNWSETASTGNSNYDDYWNSESRSQSSFTGDEYTSSSSSESYSNSKSHQVNSYSGDFFTNSSNSESKGGNSSYSQTRYNDGSSSLSRSYSTNSSVTQSNWGSSGSSSTTTNQSYSESYSEYRWNGGYSWTLDISGSDWQEGYDGNTPWTHGHSWFWRRSGYHEDSGYSNWTEDWNSDTWNNDSHSYESYSRNGAVDPISDEPDSDSNRFDKSLDDTSGSGYDNPPPKATANLELTDLLRNHTRPSPTSNRVREYPVSDYFDGYTQAWYWFTRIVDTSTIRPVDWISLVYTADLIGGGTANIRAFGTSGLYATIDIFNHNTPGFEGIREIKFTY